MFHRNLKVKRTERGMTQLSLAKALGIKERRITFLETGRVEPGIAEIVDLARVLGCNPEELDVKRFAGLKKG